MGKKASIKPAQQVVNANLVNKFGAAASSNALDTITFSSIKCHVCGRTRSTDCYSNRQILKHRNSIYNPYAPSGRSLKEYATCKDCTAAQVTTLHCFICNLDKPIESGFLKNQRNQAKPRCKGCVQYCLDTERHGAAPILDHYAGDSSDESDVDDDEDVDVDAAGSHAAEDSDDDDVDAPPAAKTNGTRTVAAPQTRTSGAGTPNISRQMGSMNLIDLSSGDEGPKTPITQSRVPTNPTSSRATPALVDILDNDANDSDGGGWATVGVAGKTNSAYRAPTWASLLASGNTTPSAAGSVSHSVATRTTTTRTATTGTTANSGYATPATAVSYTSSGRQKWGKPAKLKANDVVEETWVSRTAQKNQWAPHGGQPKLVKTKTRAHNYDSDDEDEGDE